MDMSFFFCFGEIGFDDDDVGGFSWLGKGFWAIWV